MRLLAGRDRRPVSRVPTGREGPRCTSGHPDFFLSLSGPPWFPRARFRAGIAGRLRASRRVGKVPGAPPGPPTLFSPFPVLRGFPAPVFVPGPPAGFARPDGSGRSPVHLRAPRLFSLPSRASVVSMRLLACRDRRPIARVPTGREGPRFQSGHPDFFLSLSGPPWFPRARFRAGTAVRFRASRRVGKVPGSNPGTPTLFSPFPFHIGFYGLSAPAFVPGPPAGFARPDGSGRAPVHLRAPRLFSLPSRSSLVSPRPLSCRDRRPVARVPTGREGPRCTSGPPDSVLSLSGPPWFPRARFRAGTAGRLHASRRVGKIPVSNPDTPTFFSPVPRLLGFYAPAFVPGPPAGCARPDGSGRSPVHLRAPRLFSLPSRSSLVSPRPLSCRDRRPVARVPTGREGPRCTSGHPDFFLSRPAPPWFPCACFRAGIAGKPTPRNR